MLKYKQEGSDKMPIKKYQTTPRFIKVDNAHKTIIELNYLIPYLKEDIINKIIMQRILTNSNKNYSNTPSFKKRIKELNILKYAIYTSNYQNYSLITVVLVIPEEKIIEDFNLEEAIKLFHDSLYLPDINNNQFKEEHFIWEKEYLLQQEQDYPHSIQEYNKELTIDFFDTNHEITLHREEYLEQLRQSTSQKVYQYYLKCIQNNSYFTYIYGNLDNKNKLLKTYNKYFKQEPKELK